ncbi:hypothetical protein LPJ74_006211, partial [Coemansia sp. RSA 1843]
MNLKKSAIRIMILGAIAAAVSAHHGTPNIDWTSQCAQDTVVTNWSSIRLSLIIKLPLCFKDIGYTKYQRVVALLGHGFSLPSRPSLDTFGKLVDIVGAEVMDEYVGGICTSYWRSHPCPIYTDVSSDLYGVTTVVQIDSSCDEDEDTTSSNLYEATTTSDLYEATTTSDIYEATMTSDVYEATTTSDAYEATTTSVEYEATTTSDLYQATTTSDAYEVTTTSIEYEATTTSDLYEATTTSDIYEATTTSIEYEATTTSDLYEATTTSD